MDSAALHHVAINVTDLERSRRFYRDVLGLQEIARPPFSFPGAWFQAGPSHHVHLIVHSPATTRGLKPIDTRDIHFALRVPSFRDALASLQASGYRDDAPEDDLMRMIVNRQATAGFPQIYILDPDHNVIEINAEHLD
ncbi:MAG TPA: VOC family protein [Bryobacteraceae bacterium]|nr:VOC family protein [Bryobacteraceae bacterium]